MKNNKLFAGFIIASLSLGLIGWGIHHTNMESKEKKALCNNKSESKDNKKADDNLDDSAHQHASNDQTSETTNEFDSNEGFEIDTDSFMLDVPYSEQANNYYCGPAALQMVLSYHGIYVSQDQLAEELKTHKITGTEYADLARVANHYIFENDNVGPKDAGYHVQTLDIGTITDKQRSQLLERIKTDISTGDPVFIAANVSKLYPGREDANHFIVIKGYSNFKETNNIAYLTYLDPFYINGGEYVITFDNLVDAIINNEEPAYVW